jgi:hypothetical protein
MPPALCDDGSVLGLVVRYRTCRPTWYRRRLRRPGDEQGASGARSTDQAAREAVERALNRAVGYSFNSVMSA